MITAIILASGFSRRMGRDKLLLKLGDKTIIENTIGIIKKCDFSEIIMVYRDEMVGNIGKRYNIKTIFNDRAEEGMSASVKLGVANAVNTDGYMFFTGDQPLLTADTIKGLMSQFYNNKDFIIVPRYNGRPGTPTIFPVSCKEELLRIEGDKGGRSIISKNPEKVIYLDISDENEGIDIDTWEDYERIKD